MQKFPECKPTYTQGTSIIQHLNYLTASALSIRKIKLVR